MPLRGQPLLEARSICSGPEAMHRSGALMAAMSSSSPAITALSSGSARSTDSMPPGGAVLEQLAAQDDDAQARPASDITPARQAATYSPALWPMTAAGLMPQLTHNLASAYSSVNSAGMA